MYKKLLITLVSILIVPTLIYAQTVFRSSQVGTNPVTGYYLKTDCSTTPCTSIWAPVTGGGGGSSAFSTTTAWGSILSIFPNNLTDLFLVGYSGSGVATSSNAEFVVDPTAKLGLFLNNTKVGIGTTSPYAPLSVVGEVVAEKFTATSTTATSTFGGALNVRDIIIGGPKVDVRSFNAIGDGVNDDTDEINAAFTSLPASGGTVILPPGVFKITSSIYVPSNSALECQAGSVIQVMSAIGVAISNKNGASPSSQDHDITIRGCDIRLNNTSTIGISFGGVTTALIENNKVSSSTGYGILVARSDSGTTLGNVSQYVTVSNNQIAANTDVGIEFWGGHNNIAIGNNVEIKGGVGFYTWNGENDTTITGNSVHNTGLPNIGTNCYSVQPLDNTTSNATSTARIIFTGNIARECDIGFNLIGSSTATSTDITVDSNIIYGRDNTTDIGIKATYVDRVSITGNKIVNVFKPFLTSYAVGAVPYDTVRKLSILGNTVSGGQDSEIYGMDGGNFSNNLFTNQTGLAPVVFYGVTNSVINGNVFNNTSSVAGSAGMSFTKTGTVQSTGNTISNNVAADTRTSATLRYVVSLLESSTENILFGNTITNGNGTISAVLDVSSGSNPSISNSAGEIYINGNVGIGVSNPTAKLDVSNNGLAIYGKSTSVSSSGHEAGYFTRVTTLAPSFSASLRSLFESSQTSTFSGENYALVGETWIQGNGNWTGSGVQNASGAVGIMGRIEDRSGTHTVTNAQSFISQGEVQSSATWTNYKGYAVQDPTGAGIITNTYGFYVNNLTKGTNRWQFYGAGSDQSYFGGNVGIGTTTPYAKLSVSSFNGGTQPMFAIASSTGLSATSTAFIVNHFGNVGIGTTSPISTLQVYGSIHSEEHNLATSTSMTIDFSTASSTNRMLVGSSNITVSFTNASLVPGKEIKIMICNPATGVIGTTTFSGVIWDGDTDPGSSVVNSQCERKLFYSSNASSTPIIRGGLTI